MERKLAAILAADVVGFAGLVSKDEDGTLSSLDRLINQIIRVQVEAHRGRIFKSLGDGILAEFSSTLEALKCAIGIQKALAIDAHRSGEGEPLRLRIGVSVGDVVIQGTDLLGDGVNVAARLQAMADVGGLAISSDVMAQTRGKVDIALEDCGHKRLKDSDEPIHVFKTGKRKGSTKGLFDFDENELADNLIKGSCLCGSVKIEVSLPPISTGYCHCRICQKFTGSAMSTWTAFPASGVHFPDNEPQYFASSPIVERGFCSSCGSSLAYRLVQPKLAAYLVLFTSCLDTPEKFAPTVHSGMESKMSWLDILDDFPRTTTADSRVLQEAWSSVGLPDPVEWVASAKPKDVF
jgi:adenylate cyclase